MPRVIVDRACGRPASRVSKQRAYEQGLRQCSSKLKALHLPRHSPSLRKSSSLQLHFSLQLPLTLADMGRIDSHIIDSRLSSTWDGAYGMTEPTLCDPSQSVREHHLGLSAAKKLRQKNSLVVRARGGAHKRW